MNATTPVLDTPPPSPSIAQAMQAALVLRNDMAWVGMAQGVPLQVLVDARTVRIPNTRDWFRGVVSVGGNPLPVFDLARWCGFAALDYAHAKLVAVGQGNRTCAFYCQEMPQMQPRHQIAKRSKDAGGPPAALVPYLDDNGDFDVALWLQVQALEVAGSAGIV